MNSAATLRKRGIAAIGATALIATAFGPAAMAWNSVSAAGANQAGGASFGLIDADDKADGTQGATTVSPGANDQAIGDVRFVIPSTFKKGDTLEFTIGTGTAISGITDPGDRIDSRVSFSSVPSVKIDETGYAFDTHVSPTSPIATAGAVGSVEAGKEKPYNGAGTPIAPKFKVSLENSAAGQLNDKLVIEFENDSDDAVTGAKFIGAINGAKINVGSKVGAPADVQMTVAVTGPNAPTFFGGAAPGSSATTTFPATIVSHRLEVKDGTVVADGTAQFVGPFTVSSASPVNGFDIDLTSIRNTGVSAAEFDTGARVTPQYFNAAGTDITPRGTVAIVPSASKITVPGVSNAVRVVLSGAAVKAQPGTQSVSYELNSGGAISTAIDLGAGAHNLQFNAGAVTGGGAAVTQRNQTDIERPAGVSQATATTTVVPTRIGGTNRYETAVKIAEADRGTTVGQVRGEADNVVIASGEAFPDALSSGYLAATKDAPVLLTPRGELPSTVREFLKNYGAKNVFIVGGNAAVSANVEKQLRELQSYDIQAKQQTQEVSQTVNSGTIQTATPSSGISTVANISFTDVPGNSFPSSMTITVDDSDGTVGDVTPRVATNLPGATISITGANTASLTYDGTTTTVAIPTVTDNMTAVVGTFAISSTQRTLTTTENVAGGPTDRTATGDSRVVVPLNTNLQVTRIGGFNRFDTNRRVNEYAGATSATPVGTMVSEYGKPGRKTALLANGMTPWDSLAAGPLVGNGGGNPVPLVLTAGDGLHQAAKDQMQTTLRVRVG